jgi:hypothetical protein
MSKRRNLAAGLMALATAITLAACDRTEERIDRAREVTEAAIDQVAGNGEAAPKGTDMESVPLEARAFAGSIQTEPMIVNTESAPRSRFAIGSIIAKPRDLPQLPTPTEALVMQRPELAEELAVELPR